MHKYKYIVTIELPCTECGMMNSDVIFEILDNAAAGIPTHDIFVEDISDHKCNEATAHCSGPLAPCASDGT
jgi:hypothetical protein